MGWAGIAVMYVKKKSLFGSYYLVFWSKYYLKYKLLALNIFVIISFTYICVYISQKFNFPVLFESFKILVSCLIQYRYSLVQVFEANIDFVASKRCD